MRGSCEVNAPSLNTGSVKRLVVAIGTVRPVASRAFLNLATMRSRSAAFASIGTRSLSWKFTPHAPSSASRSTATTGSSAGLTNSPNGSRPRLPTVQSPKVNLSAGLGSYVMARTVPYEYTWAHVAADLRGPRGVSSWRPAMRCGDRRGRVAPVRTDWRSGGSGPLRRDHGTDRNARPVSRSLDGARRTRSRPHLDARSSIRSAELQLGQPNCRCTDHPRDCRRDPTRVAPGCDPRASQSRCVLDRRHGRRH